MQEDIRIESGARQPGLLSPAPAARESSLYLIGMVSGFFLAGSGIIFLTIYGGILAAYQIGDLLHREWLGFALIVFFYVLLGAMTWICRKRLCRIPLLNRIIGDFLS
jgi:hypothetical protein